MKLFLDTNVVLDYLAKRQPFAEDAHHIILEGSLRGWVLCISALSFTTIDYVLRKLYDQEQRIALLTDISNLFTICSVDGTIIQEALCSKFTDFEDAVQYHTAKSYDIDILITRNTKDFTHSTIPVQSPTEFCNLLKGYSLSDSTSLLNEPAVPYETHR